MKVYSWAGSGSWQLKEIGEITPTLIDFFTTWGIYADDELLENGPMLGNFIMDFDSENLEHAKDDTLYVYEKLKSQGVNPNSIILFFSGSKGFHLEVDYKTFLFRPLFSLPEIYELIAEEIGIGAPYQTFDKVIYSAKRMWRYPNTINSKTGLYCTFLTPGMMGQNVEQIKEWARKKQTDLRGKIPGRDEGFCRLMQKAIEKNLRELEYFDSRVALTTYDERTALPCINQLLASGAAQSNRNNALYVLACYFKRKNKKEDEVLNVLLSWAAKNGTEEREAAQTISSAYRSARDGIGCRNPILREKCDRGKCSISREIAVSGAKAYVEENYFTMDFKQAEELVKERKAKGFYDRFVKTGFFGLDRWVKICRDTFLVIGANTAIGKSTFLSTLAFNLERQGKKAVYFSLEENIDRATHRLLRMGYRDDGGGFRIVKPRHGLMKVEDVEKFLSIYAPDIVLLDQLTWLDCDRAITEERIRYREMMKKLYGLTQSISPVPVVILHQLNRMALLKEGLPGKEFLAEGADVERLATDVWIMVRITLSGGDKITCMFVDKNRWGEGEKLIMMRFNSEKVMFEELNREEVGKIIEQVEDSEVRALLRLDDYFQQEGEKEKIIREFFK